jgi:hypothetical protein
VIRSGIGPGSVAAGCGAAALVQHFDRRSRAAAGEGRLADGRAWRDSRAASWWLVAFLGVRVRLVDRSLDASDPAVGSMAAGLEQSGRSGTVRQPDVVLRRCVGQAGVGIARRPSEGL